MAWDDASYPLRRTVTYDATNIDANLSDFPVLLKLEAADAIASADIASKRYRVFDHNGVECDFEQESWGGGDPATFEDWCEVPDFYAVPAGDQNKVRVYYDHDPGSDQDNATGTWDANHKLVAHMSEASGTVADSTSNGNDTVAESGVTYAQTGKVHRAIDINGTGETDPGGYLQWADDADLSPGAGDFTIEAWVKSDDIDVTWGGAWTDYGVDTNNFINLAQVGTHWRTTFRDSAGDKAEVLGAETVDTNWHHIVGVRDGTTARLYVDGEPDGTDDDPSLGTITVSDGDGPAIGRPADPTEYGFPGLIGELRLSKGIARSAAWVKFGYVNVNEAENELSWGGEEQEGVAVYGTDSADAAGREGATASLPADVVSGDAISGANLDKMDSDDDTDHEKSATGNYAWVQVMFDVTQAEGDVTQLDLHVDGFMDDDVNSMGGGGGVQIHCWNDEDSTWDAIGTQSPSATETDYDEDISSGIGDYINADGEIFWRLSAYHFEWDAKVSIDNIDLTVTYEESLPTYTAAGRGRQAVCTAWAAAERGQAKVYNGFVATERGRAALATAYSRGMRGQHYQGYEPYEATSRGRHQRRNNFPRRVCGLSAVQGSYGGTGQGLYGLQRTYAESGCGHHVVLTPWSDSLAGRHQVVGMVSYVGMERGRHAVLLPYAEDGRGLSVVLIGVTCAGRGLSRVANDALALYEVYRGVDAEPDLDAAPWETFESLPHVTAALAASHSYYFVTEYRNTWDLRSERIASWVVTLDADGDVVGDPPSAPEEIRLTPAADGAVRVRAVYRYLADDEALWADRFAAWLTSDGSTPDPADTPTHTVTPAMVDGLATLDWTSGTYADGLTIKALVRVQRLDDPDWINSTNTDIVSTTADAQGPDATDEAGIFFGTVAEQHQ